MKLGKVETPMGKGFHTNDEDSPKFSDAEQTKSRSIAGTLLYLTYPVRSDIAFAISLLSQFVGKARANSLQYTDIFRSSSASAILHCYPPLIHSCVPSFPFYPCPLYF